MNPTLQDHGANSLTVSPSPHSPEAVPAARPRTPRRRWLPAAALLLAVGGLYLLGQQTFFPWDSARQHLDILLVQVQRRLLEALFLFVVIDLTATALALPVGSILAGLAGAMFGRWLGGGAACLASTLGATLAFLAGRFLLPNRVRRRFGERLESLRRGAEREGADYLFRLRLAAPLPASLVNQGMGLTRMRVWTFAAVTLLGILPLSLVYANVGSALAGIDAPADLLSPGVFVSVALAVAAPWTLRKLADGNVRLRIVGCVAAGLLFVAALGLAARTYVRYQTADVMQVPVQEYSNADYPEDPAVRSVHFGQYDGRKLTLVRKDDAHFDFVLEPTRPHVAAVVFRDVDVSLMTPGLPAWTRDDDGLTRIALTDRQWNRQQVRFEANSPHVEITGGDGFETAHLASAELAKNCLNAGLWEVLLFNQENGKKTLYYHNWFTFPLGHYARLFERNTGLPYWRHWYYLEHWFDPSGTPVRLDGLRQVVREWEAPTRFDPGEAVLAAGEQVQKRRTMMAEDVLAWKDFYDGRKVRFAQFIPPGRYSVGRPWKNEYWRMTHFEKGIWREIRSAASGGRLHELELVFTGDDGQTCRFIVSGFDAAALPQLPVEEYPKGLYMPMGIGVPPFNQGYDELTKNPPDASPYFCVMLDAEGRWINHHDVAVDGPVMHRDASDPDLLHVYLLSYERHSLIGHFVVSIKE